jgi:hypothetical protein
MEIKGEQSEEDDELRESELISDILLMREKIAKAKEGIPLDDEDEYLDRDEESRDEEDDDESNDSDLERSPMINEADDEVEEAEKGNSDSDLKFKIDLLRNEIAKY